MCTKDINRAKNRKRYIWAEEWPRECEAGMQISYEEALKKAKRLKRNIDACDEYDIAWGFKCRAEQYNIGGDGACYILKDSGRAICQTEFHTNYEGKHIREFDIQ